MFEEGTIDEFGEFGAGVLGCADLGVEVGLDRSGEGKMTERGR
jgi:hypothetical protein